MTGPNGEFNFALDLQVQIYPWLYEKLSNNKFIIQRNEHISTQQLAPLIYTLLYHIEVIKGLRENAKW